MSAVVSNVLSKSYISLATLLLALCGLLLAVSNGGGTRRSLRIATCNTHLLPRVGQAFASHRGQPEYRADRIGRWSSGYELVGLCEVFDDHYRQILIDEAQRSPAGKFHLLWTPKPPGAHFTNSGLLLLSRFPIVAHHAVSYAHASRFMTHGFRADAFAAKGALHARLKVGQSPLVLVDCFLTHLESRSGDARARQLEDLAKFMAEHGSAGRGAILLGDLNVPANPPHGPPQFNSPYGRLLAAIRTSGLRWGDVWPHAGIGPAGTSDPLADDGGRRIDYIFLSPHGPAERSAWRPIRALVLRLLDDEVAERSLSDHAAVECEAELLYRSLRDVRREKH